MSPSDFKWYVQNAIEQCDYLMRNNHVDYHKLINQIIKIREIGLTYDQHMIKDCASKLVAYRSEDHELNLFEQMLAFLVNLKGPMPFSNKENSKQERYLIQSKLILHGIDEALRREGH